MKTLTLFLAGSLLATAAVAQTTSTSPSNPASPASPASPGVTPSPLLPGANTGPGTGGTAMPGPATGAVPGAGALNRNTGPDAAAGDTNQAVATTSANAMQPAKGANSFTDDQAKGRIESGGYSTVTDLKKDDDGIWRGSATKDGAKVNVWLDYKGNVGQN